LNNQGYALAALALRKRPGAHPIGGWVGQTAGLNGCSKTSSPPGFDFQTVQTVLEKCRWINITLTVIFASAGRQAAQNYLV